MIDIQKEIEKKFPNMDKKENFLKKSLFKIAKKIVHEDSINQFLTQNSHLKGFEFVDAVFLEFCPRHINVLMRHDFVFPPFLQVGVIHCVVV